MKDLEDHGDLINGMKGMAQETLDIAGQVTQQLLSDHESIKRSQQNVSISTRE